MHQAESEFPLLSLHILALRASGRWSGDPAGRTVERVTEPTSEARAAYLDERGVLITVDGRERARAQLAELDGKRTPEQREQRRLALLARINAA